VFGMTGHRDPALVAIPLDSTGDITGTDKIVWQMKDGPPYVPSALLYDGLLYFTKSRNAILSCVDARTGKALIDQKRLPEMESLYASPVGAAGRIYLSSREGATLVIKQSKELEILATNHLDETIDASPAIVGKEMYIRGENHLYCIAEK
jgi:outer membrane protein assembly factor BamB